MSTDARAPTSNLCASSSNLCSSSSSQLLAEYRDAKPVSMAPPTNALVRATPKRSVGDRATPSSSKRAKRDDDAAVTHDGDGRNEAANDDDDDDELALDISDGEHREISGRDDMPEDDAHVGGFS